MNTNLLNIVKQISAQYGESILDNPNRLKAVFSDRAKDEPKPLRMAFGRCVENGAYGAMKTAPDAAERASRKRIIAQRLRDEQGIDSTFSHEAMDILETVMYGTAGAAQAAFPPTPPPAQYRQSTPPAYQQPYQQAAPPRTPPASHTAPVHHTPPASHTAPVHHTPPASYTPPAPPTPFTPPVPPPQSPYRQPYPVPAAKSHTLRNVLIAVAAVAVVAVIAGIFLFLPQFDTALKNTALEIAYELDSEAFEGYDPGEGITHYYFIPVTSLEALGMGILMLFGGNYDGYVTSYDTDSGIIKARNAGYYAKYGIMVYREYNQRSGEIIIAPAAVTSE